MRKPDFDYQKLELEQVLCPVCGNREFVELAKVDRYRMGISTSGCMQCGLVMTNPRPSVSAMDEFYRFHYRNYYESVEIPDQAYIKKIHKDVRAKYTVDFIEQSGIFDETRRVLDFGCGEGSLLREISARWPEFETEAVEPGESFREFSRKYADCKVYVSLEELQKASAGNFDLISVNHVLEHIMWPNEVLVSLRELLSSQGHIYIDVPAIEGYSSVESLHIGHMYHFSEDTLRTLADSTGYKVVSIERHQPPCHPVSLRCLIAPDNLRSHHDDSDKDGREACWSKIKAIHKTAWKFFVMSSLPVKAALYFPRRLMRIMGQKTK